jgi:FdhE protein
MSSDFYELAHERLADAKANDPDMAGFFEYNDAIVSAQQQASAAYLAAEPAALDAEALEQRIKAGNPCLTAEDLVVDRQHFDSLFATLSEVRDKCAEPSDPEGERRAAADMSDEWHMSLFNALLGDSASFAQCAADIGMPAAPFTFLASRSIAPFAIAYAERLSFSPVDAGWRSGHCPVCGSEPLMGKLSGDVGKRDLQCHLCNTEWAFTRLACPFCDNEDSEKLKYFFSKDDSTPHRLDVCACCSNYLKTIDTRDLADPPFLFVEHLATLHLDIVAGRKGFRRNTDPLFDLLGSELPG